MDEAYSLRLNRHMELGKIGQNKPREVPSSPTAEGFRTAGHDCIYPRQELLNRLIVDHFKNPVYSTAVSSTDACSGSGKGDRTVS
jgi:hypothetical protein